ncbi:MAG TPA: energy transducer TonB [Myxococcales bacterium]
MRRLALLLVLAAACAHGPRPIVPSEWHELRTEHFTLRTDLPLEDARRTAVDLEEVRQGLLAAGWHAAKVSPGRTQVIELASDREMQEYAIKGLEGFVTGDAFNEPIMVINGSQDAHDQRFLKHELAHVITNGFLVRNPRWVAEGIACYLETLHFDRRRGELEVGDLEPNRLRFLKERPPPSYWSVIRTGREAEQMSAEDGYAFETGAWILVHWLVDTRTRAFDSMLARLARGEDQYYAFSAEFPDLTEASIKQGIDAYFKAGKISVRYAPAPRWKGEVAERALAAGEVYAVLADLQRISPGYPKTPERAGRLQSLLATALQEDPGNPLALQLSGGGDASLATRLHPEDWRAWVLVGDRNPGDHAAVEKAAQLAPDDPGVLMRLAWARENQGDRRGALENATRALELAPGRSDVLDTLAHMQAADGRCNEAAATEQHAIDVLPDGASPSTLRKRAAQLDTACMKQAAVVERSVMGSLVLRSCNAQKPRLGRRDKVRGAIAAKFVIGEDGAVSSVEVTGDASRSALAAVRKYVESCTYEPLQMDGKPVRTEAEVKFQFEP